MSNSPDSMEWTPAKGQEALRVMAADLAALQRPTKLLLVDETEDLKVMRKALDGYPALVDECDDLDVASVLILNGDYDVVILDLNIPPGDGIKVLKTVKPIKPQQKFVVVTGSEQGQLRVDALKAGAYLFILKEEFDSQLKNLFAYIGGSTTWMKH